MASTHCGPGSLGPHEHEVRAGVTIFGDKAGAASALVGFWQMMTAAIGVWLAATISREAMFALGVVLTVFSLAAVGLYTLRAKAR